MREYVPLDAELAALVEAIRSPGTPERMAVESLTGPLPQRPSKAATLALLLRLAGNAVTEVMEYASYAEEAANRTVEDSAIEQAQRARRERQAVAWSD